MTKEALIKRTITTLNVLPTEKANEVADFADYVLKKHEEFILQSGIEKLVEQSEAFHFLKDEEDLYTEADIKKTY